MDTDENWGVEYYVRTIHLKWWQVPLHWWRCKFGRYKSHYLKITDKDGNDVTSERMKTAIRNQAMTESFPRK